MTIRPLPNLNSLRAFEAAARLGSFKLAGDELHVTHAAISRHIRLLEEELQLQLFLRLHRKVVLTPTGSAYFQDIHAAFDAIVRSSREITGKQEVQRLALHCETSFGHRWLIRRLHKFRVNHPDIEVDIISTTTLPNLPDSRIDAIIHYGFPAKPELRQDHMISLRAFPLCSPELIAGKRGGLHEPTDLRRFRLLHEGSTKWWHSWLSAATADSVNPNRGPIYHDYSLLLDAAIAQEGVIIGDDVIAYDDIIAGKLTIPFKCTLPAQSYYFICHQSRTKDPKIEVFRRWLLDECAIQIQASAALNAS